MKKSVGYSPDPPEDPQQDDTGYQSQSEYYFPEMANTTPLTQPPLGGTSAPADSPTVAVTTPLPGEEVPGVPNPQEDSPLFSTLPTEVRDRILGAAVPGPGHRVHIFAQNGTFRGTRCIRDGLVRGDGSPDMPAVARHIDIRLNRVAILPTHMRCSNWGEHWMCEASMLADDLLRSLGEEVEPVGPLLGLMLSCRRGYLEARDVLGTNMTFDLMDPESEAMFPDLPRATRVPARVVPSATIPELAELASPDLLEVPFFGPPSPPTTQTKGTRKRHQPPALVSTNTRTVLEMLQSWVALAKAVTAAALTPPLSSADFFPGWTRGGTAFMRSAVVRGTGRTWTVAGVAMGRIGSGPGGPTRATAGGRGLGQGRGRGVLGSVLLGPGPAMRHRYSRDRALRRMHPYPLHHRPLGRHHEEEIEEEE